MCASIDVDTMVIFHFDKKTYYQDESLRHLHVCGHHFYVDASASTSFSKIKTSEIFDVTWVIFRPTIFSIQNGTRAAFASTCVFS
jgi:hypothetical protein